MDIASAIASTELIKPNDNYEVCPQGAAKGWRPTLEQRKSGTNRTSLAVVVTPIAICATAFLVWSLWPGRREPFLPRDRFPSENLLASDGDHGRTESDFHCATVGAGLKIEALGEGRRLTPWGDGDGRGSGKHLQRETRRVSRESCATSSRSWARRCSGDRRLVVSAMNWPIRNRVTWRQ